MAPQIFSHYPMHRKTKNNTCTCSNKRQWNNECDCHLKTLLLQFSKQTAFNRLWNHVYIETMVLQRPQDSGFINITVRLSIILNVLPTDVCKSTTHSFEKCLTSTCIPAFTAWTCKYICICSPFQQQQHFVSCPTSLQYFIRLHRLYSLYYGRVGMRAGCGDNASSCWWGDVSKAKCAKTSYSPQGSSKLTSLGLLFVAIKWLMNDPCYRLAVHWNTNKYCHMIVQT